jgi:hypothetical protein
MDYPATVVLLCLARAVSRRPQIQPKARDTGWIVVPHLWEGIIAPPGYLKSPVIQAATRPLTQIEDARRCQHDDPLKSPYNRPQFNQDKRVTWSHPPGSNRRPADYETKQVAIVVISMRGYACGTTCRFGRCTPS